MRRLWIIGVAVVVLLAAGHAVLWHLATTRLDREVRIWIAQRQAQGWTATTAPFERHGWPFAARIRIPNVHMTGMGQDVTGGIDYEAEEVDLGLSLFQPRRFVIRWGGLQRLRVGPGPSIPFTGDHIEAGIAISPDVPPREGELVAEGLRLDLPGAGAVMAGRLRLRIANLPPASGGSPVLEGSIDATGIVLPPTLAPPTPAIDRPTEALGQSIARLGAEISLAGTLPRQLPGPQRLATWRDSGGSIALRQIFLDWGKLSFRGSATLALDDRLQPMGTATARITGHNEALDALVAAGLLPARTALAAKAILGLLGKKQEDGPPVVEVPLTLQDRTLQLGRIPLARLPEIIWPSAP